MDRRRSIRKSKRKGSEEKQEYVEDFIIGIIDTYLRNR